RPATPSCSAAGSASGPTDSPRRPCWPRTSTTTREATPAPSPVSSPPAGSGGAGVALRDALRCPGVMRKTSVYLPARLKEALAARAPATAVDAVGRAEAVVRQAVPGLRVERITFTMVPGRVERDRSVAAAARVLAAYLDAGEEVAFVTLGDPLTYSTFTSVATAVRGRRPATVVEQVPGIMAFQALAARTGTTVTDERQRLLVRTALEGEDVGAELAEPGVTGVLNKG